MLSRKRRNLAVLAGVAATIAAVVVAMNFTTPEKKIQKTLAHLHSVSDPQFRREMAVMLGPGLLGGNRVVALENGVEIFPSMLEAIRGAKHTINFET